LKKQIIIYHFSLNLIKILDLIKKDQKKLEDLIAISEKIKFQECQNCKSIKRMLFTFVLMALGLVGSFKTSNFNSVLNGISFLANIITLIIDLKNFSDSSKSIKQYKEYKNLLQS